MKFASTELFHEYALAEHVARVRTALAVACLLVLSLDYDASGTSTGAFALGMCTAGAMLVFAIVALAALRYRWFELRALLLVTPVFDVLLASLLIASTGGYLSPFNVLLVFGVISSGLGRHWMLPLLAAMMGLAAHSLIAMIPQDRPLDLSVFAVRSGYLFATAAIISSFSHHLTELARMMKTLNSLSRELAQAGTAQEVGQVLQHGIEQTLKGCSMELDLNGVHMPPRRNGRVSPDRVEPLVQQLESGGHPLATLRLWRARPMKRTQRVFIDILCSRGASSLLRIRMADELQSAAAAAERTRLADQLHDTYLQSLAALDLRAEVALAMADGTNGQLQVELHEIKRIARLSASHLREVFRMYARQPTPGPDTLRRLMDERWNGKSDVSIPADIRLTDDQWRALEMLVSEGLNNARKHARASHVSLRIDQGEIGGVSCTLWNDGAIRSGDVQPGYGLSRLRQVVEGLQGELLFACGRDGDARLTAVFGNGSGEQS